MEYTIKSLKDIFELPTPDHMERCLEEVIPFLRSTRAMKEIQEEIIRTAAQAEGIELDTNEQIFEFPEVVIWKDDSKGEHLARFQYTEDKFIDLTMLQSVSDPQNCKAD